MSWFSKMFGRSPTEPIQAKVEQQDDGSQVVSTSFTLSADTMREVRDDVVESLDNALAEHGEVTHAIDPARMMRFDAGGPAVWSVGMTLVPGAQPYWLWVTYGFSGTLSPVDYRNEFQHEYSLAVPQTDANPPMWPVTLLRSISGYVLRSRAELKVGDHMPCQQPITQLGLSPEDQAQVPSTELTGLLISRDPLIPSVDTPHGPLELRRCVGLRGEEISFVQRWSSTSFLEEMQKTQPDLLTNTERSSLLEHPPFMEAATVRAAKEGSSLGVLFVEGGWREAEEGGVELLLPGGADGQTVHDIWHARVPFGRPLFLQGPPEFGCLCFEAAEVFSLDLNDQDVLLIKGKAEHPQVQAILKALSADSSSVRIHFAG